MGNHTQSRRLTILALFSAIILLQNFVPLIGYIQIGPLAITTIHITVIIAAIVLGPVDGAIVGGIWGLVDWIRALMVMSSPLGNVVMRNPLISILPRIIIGLVAGYLVSWFVSRHWNLQLSMVTAAIIGSIINTVLVLGGIYLFYHNGSGAFSALNIKALMPYLISVAGINGVPEAIAAAIIAPLIATPLLKYTAIGQARFK